LKIANRLAVDSTASGTGVGRESHRRLHNSPLGRWQPGPSVQGMSSVNESKKNWIRNTLGRANWGPGGGGQLRQWRALSSRALLHCHRHTQLLPLPHADQADAVGGNCRWCPSPPPCVHLAGWVL